MQEPEQIWTRIRTRGRRTTTWIINKRKKMQEERRRRKENMEQKEGEGKN